MLVIWIGAWIGADLTKCTVGGNYRPISLTFVICKVMKRIMRDEMMSHISRNWLISSRQSNTACAALFLFDELAWDDRSSHRGAELRLSSGARLPWLPQGILQAFTSRTATKARISQFRRSLAEVAGWLPQRSSPASCPRRSDVQLARRHQRCATRISARSPTIHRVHQRSTSIGQGLHVPTVRGWHQATRGHSQCSRHGSCAEGHRHTSQVG